MNPAEAARLYLLNRSLRPIKSSGMGRACANVALIKYWGKRCNQINLPMNSSLSLSMGKKGALTRVTVADDPVLSNDIVYVNGQVINARSPFAINIGQFLDILAVKRPYFQIKTWLNIPHSAGLASSSAGFAALILAIDALCGWQLPKKTLSLLARLGSGSAARSFWPGFVEWQAGEAADGHDSFATPIHNHLPNLRLGLILIDNTVKSISSRRGMLDTVISSPLYKAWPSTAANDLIVMKQAINNRDFTTIGSTAEANALAMHATMLAARPALMYSTTQTLAMMQQIWQLRRSGLEVYFTQDAGPNLKLLFELKNQHQLQAVLPDLHVIIPQ